VLHGSSGTGKTLLCDVLVDEWRSRFPEHRLVRLDATEFARRYAQAVDADAIEPLRTEWRGADLLVVEDLQRIGSKQQAQWELLHTLDALEQRGSYVVVTLETPPSQLDALLPGIVSRLTAGLVVATAPPSTATRRAIIERFATARRWNVEAKVLDILAADLETGVPELLGTMAGLEASARADDQSFDAAYVRRYLDHRADTRAPTLKAIAETTARHFGLKVADLKSSSRRRTAVAARDAAVFLARRMTNKSLQEIGAYFGGRDHTTILHSFRKIEASLGGDAVVRQTFETLRNRWGKIG
jgi:chromosomal replication initiator protein